MPQRLALHLSETACLQPLSPPAPRPSRESQLKYLVSGSAEVSRLRRSLPKPYCEVLVLHHTVSGCFGCPFPVSKRGSTSTFLRVSPEFHLQKPRRQFKTHCLKLSSRMGLLPGVLRGPRRLLPGAVSLNSKGGVLLQHVSQLSLSSSSRYSGFKLLPPWHQVPHAFGSQVFIPPTTTTKKQPSE